MVAPPFPMPDHPFNGEILPYEPNSQLIKISTEGYEAMESYLNWSCVSVIPHKFQVSCPDFSIPLLFIFSFVLPYPLSLLHLYCIKALGTVLHALLPFLELRGCHGIETEQSRLLFHVLFWSQT